MEILKTVTAAVFSVCELFLLTKIMGRRQISQLSFFDYIIGISIGSIAAEMGFAEFKNIWRHALSMLIYAVFAVVLSYLGDKSVKFRRAVEGESLKLIDNGKIVPENFKKTRIDINEFMTQCRINGYFSPEDIHTAIMEPNGTITFLPKSNKRPIETEDLKLDVKEANVPMVVIADGKVFEDNLKLCGKDINWLHKQIKETDSPAADKIFLALCDENKLIVFKSEKNKGV